MRRILAETLFTSVLVIPLPSVAADGATNDVRDTVLNAWQQRCRNIRSIEYQCTVQTSRLRKHGPVKVDPLEGPHDGAVEVTKTTFKYAISGEKLAFDETSEAWDPKSSFVRPKHIKAAFNGKVCQWLHEEGPVAFGEISSRPDGILAAYIYLTPLLLSSMPLRELERDAYRPQEVTVANADSSYDGIHCLELILPRRNPQWRGRLFVDPARDFIPLRFISGLRGKVSRDLSMQYVPNSKAGWNIAAWKDLMFDDTGSDLSIMGQVVSCQINESLGDEVFTFTFPDGTQVAERDGEGERYFVARPDSESADNRESISKEQFGTLNPTAIQSSHSMTAPWHRVLIPATALLAILGIPLIARFLRSTKQASGQ